MRGDYYSSILSHLYDAGQCIIELANFPKKDDLIEKTSLLANIVESSVSHQRIDGQ